jgi:predicted negative regulator of RcsB-dependent stress response
MKAKKLLDKLKDILSAERYAQLAKYSSLKKVLKALRVEKTRLKKELAEASDENEQQEIAIRLKVISVQRKKGLMVLKELKKERK